MTTMEREPRQKALPEGAHYEDHGCGICDKALECPYEFPPPCETGSRRFYARQRWNIDARQQKARDLRDAGWTIEAIAAELGCVRRTVFRLLSSS